MDTNDIIGLHMKSSTACLQKGVFSDKHRSSHTQSSYYTCAAGENHELPKSVYDECETKYQDRYGQNLKYGRGTSNQVTVVGGKQFE